MKKIFAVMLALAMVLTMVACGKKADTKPEAKDKIGSAQTGMELYVTTAENGDKTVVDKSGAAAEGFTLDASGNIVDKDGQIIVAADKVQQLPAKTADKTEPDTKAEDAKSGSSNRASSDVSSSSSSSGSSSSGSPSSGGSESSSSSSSSGSSALTPTAPPQPVHTHSWQPVYRDVEVDDYEMKCFTLCSVCDMVLVNPDGSEPNGDSLQHESAHMLAGEGGGTYERYEQVRVGSHIEQQLTGYTCSCGATKEP